MLKIGCRDKILEALEDIEDLLENPKFGLAEIKDEVKDIEDALKALTKNKGPLTTGPILALNDQNVVTVCVQNLDKCPVDVEVKLFDIQCCPPKEVDSKCLKKIGRCCAEAAVLCAHDDGIFEVVCCPEPERATIRAFASVHGGCSRGAGMEFVVTAGEFLSLTCPFCKKDRCRRDCRPCD